MSDEKCSVCESQTNEYHFGSDTRICKACAAFFRRFVLSPKTTIRCRSQQDCLIHFKNAKFCRYCRMEKCKKAGMKESAVQPPRDKYKAFSKGNSPNSPTYTIVNPIPAQPSSSISNSNVSYSRSPNPYEVQCCSNEMPTLIRISENFKNLERSRRIVFQNEDTPRSRNMGEILQIMKKDMLLMSTFTERSFPEIHYRDKHETKQLFLHLFIKYMLLEPPFLALMTDKNKIILPNGDYYDENIGNLYTGHLKAKKISKQEAEKIFGPYYIDYKRTVFEEILHIKPDVYEYLFLVTLIFWDDGLEGLSEDAISQCRRMRERAVSEIIVYYEKVKKVDDPCLRLAQTMMLLQCLQKTFVKCQEEMEISGFYEIYKHEMDGTIFQIINQSLQL